MKALLFFAFLTGSKAWAFPEMIRHGYIQCTACHTTLVGGNLLNTYGRSLSRELLSQKTLFGKASQEGDEQMGMGLVELPPWLLSGGDVRLLQSFVESKQASKGRFFIMQIEVNFLAEIHQKIKTFLGVGRLEPASTEASAKDFVYFPRFGFEFPLSAPESEQQWGFRLGRFMPAYGINFAEHTFVTRQVLEFGPGQERFGGELSWLNDQYSVIATGIWGQANGLKNKFEQGGIIQLSRSLGEKSKIGVNHYQTQREQGELKYTRKISGAYAMIGFTHDWYGLLEVDQPTSADDKSGLVNTFKLGHEIEQGLQIFGTQEFSNLNIENADPKFEAYGLGVQWYPRPHWEIYSVYRREKNTSIDKDFQDVVWIIGHFYL